MQNTVKTEGQGFLKLISIAINLNTSFPGFFLSWEKSTLNTPISDCISVIFRKLS